MRHARVLGLAGLAIAAVGAVAFAQTTVAPLPDNAPVVAAPLEIDLSKTTWGDAAAGQTKATACAACHGVDGNKTLDNTYPKLAGQYSDYLLKALQDYKSGKRSNAIMAGQVQNLSEADMANLAVYFNSLPGQMGIIH